MSNLLSVKLFIRDVSKRGIKNFPIRGKYLSGAQANLSLSVEKLTDEKGYVALNLLPNARYAISVMTTKGVFEHNATINTDVAAQKPFVIIGLSNPIDSYISTRELRIVDLEDKPVANCKYKMMYLGKTIYQTVGVDGKKKIKSLVGEPVTITVLKPDNSEVATATFTYTSHKVNGGSFRLLMPIHQNQPTTAPNQPTTPQPLTPPATNHIALLDAHKLACEVTSYNEGAIHPNDPNDRFKILAGNGDLMGMSWGMVQWNFGQNTLGPLLKKMIEKNVQAFDACFHNPSQLQSLKSALNSNIIHQKQWAITMQTATNSHEWKSIFNKLGDIPDFQELQVEATFTYRNIVISDIQWMKSKLPNLIIEVPLYMYCALFDLAVQHGGIKKINNSGVEVVRSALEANWNANPPPSLKEALIQSCKKRAQAGNHQYSADSFSRRMTIINQQTTSETLYGITRARANPKVSLINNSVIVDGIL